MKNYRYLLSLILLIPFAVSAQDNEDANASEVEEIVAEEETVEEETEDNCPSFCL